MNPSSLGVCTGGEDERMLSIIENTSLGLLESLLPVVKGSDSISTVDPTCLSLKGGAGCRLMTSGFRLNGKAVTSRSFVTGDEWKLGERECSNVSSRIYEMRDLMDITTVSRGPSGETELVRTPP
jgi:hypothetical protein